MRSYKLIVALFAVLTACCASVALPARAQTQPAQDLRMVIVVSRHGVRSPTHPAELNPYSATPWPAWRDKPGYLTARGAVLMKQYGAYYRSEYAGLLGAGDNACPANGSVFVWADVDERTVATGDAIVQGLGPNCGITVGHAPADPDLLFDPLPSIGTADKAESTASILGAVGGNFDALTAAYGSTLATMERVLGCEAPSACKQISQIPSSVKNGGDGGLAGIEGGLDMAADVAENLLLEYTDGHPNVGWGRVDHARLVELLRMHVLGKTLEHRNRYTARVHSSNIMAHIMQTLEEGATNAPVAGTKVPPQARFVFISGHDTQLAELSGLLRLSWAVRGDQANDTPPGSALIFELHGAGAKPYVRTFFTSQTLDAMRTGHGEHPERVPVYVPGCPGLDCPFDTFRTIVGGAIDPAFVAPW